MTGHSDGDGGSRKNRFFSEVVTSLARPGPRPPQSNNTASPLASSEFFQSRFRGERESEGEGEKEWVSTPIKRQMALDPIPLQNETFFQTQRHFSVSTVLTQFGGNAPFPPPTPSQVTPTHTHIHTDTQKNRKKINQSNKTITKKKKKKYFS